MESLENQSFDSSLIPAWAQANMVLQPGSPEEPLLYQGPWATKQDLTDSPFANAVIEASA